jgi:hypothetical protein
MQCLKVNLQIRPIDTSQLTRDKAVRVRPGRPAEHVDILLRDQCHDDQCPVVGSTQQRNEIFIRKRAVNPS